MKIAHKNIILTGAASGIGKDLLKQLIDFEGVKIIAVDCKPSINPIFQYLYRFTTFVKIQYTHDKGN